MLVKQQKIAGYEGFRNQEDETDKHNPFETVVKFSVVSEEMPALSRAEGKIVRKNFVWITKTMNLGNAILNRRIYDTVHFDESKGQWVVDQLGVPESDIEQYVDQWNAFVEGHADGVVGTPLLLLFKNDPARCDDYARHNVKFVEQLAAFNDHTCDSFGMGAADDRRKAQAFLAKVSQMAPGLKVESALAEKDEKISSLQTQLNDLSSKLSALLAAQDGKDPTPSRRGRPPAKHEDSSSVIA